MNKFTPDFYNSVKNELFNDILPYWQKHACDTKAGQEGFFGAIDNQNVPDSKIQRSIVMTSRFLWTYSAVARLTKNSEYLNFCLDILTEVAESLSEDKNKFSEDEAFCLVNIIIINFSFLKYRSVDDTAYISFNK